MIAGNTGPEKGTEAKVEQLSSHCHSLKHLGRALGWVGGGRVRRGPERPEKACGKCSSRLKRPGYGVGVCKCARAVAGAARTDRQRACAGGWPVAGGEKLKAAGRERWLVLGPAGGNPKKGPSGEEEGEEGSREEGKSLQRENEQESENRRKNREPGLEI